MPERCDTCHLLRGNSNFHRRFGYSCHVNALKERLAACGSCIQNNYRMITNNGLRVQTDNICTKCNNWSFEGTNGNHLQFDIPANFPKSADTITETQLSMKKL